MLAESVVLIDPVQIASPEEKSTYYGKVLVIVGIVNVVVSTELPQLAINTLIIVVIAATLFTLTWLIFRWCFSLTGYVYNWRKLKFERSKEKETKRMFLWTIKSKKIPPVKPEFNFEENPPDKYIWALPEELKCENCLYNKPDPFWASDSKNAQKFARCKRPLDAKDGWGTSNMFSVTEVKSRYKAHCGKDRKYFTLPLHPGQKALQEIYV